MFTRFFVDSPTRLADNTAGWKPKRQVPACGIAHGWRERDETNVAMAKTSKIDLFFESLTMWATTGRICEDLYFRIRHYYFRIVATLNHCWLPLVRQAERELRAYREYLKPQYSWRERWGLGRLRPLLILCLPIVATVVLISVADFPSLVQEDVDSTSAVLTGILKTTGAVLATLTAILLTVTALAIQTTLANLPGTGFLLGSFARRQGFIPVAAFLFGTLTSIVAGVALAGLWGRQTLNDWVVLTTASACVAALLLFDLLRRTIQGLGQTDVAHLLRTELTNNWRLHTHATFRRILLEVRLRGELARFGFGRHVCSESKEGHETEFHLTRNGHVAAVDIGPLRRIGRLLSMAPIKPNLELTYRGWLGGRGTNLPSVTIPEDGQITPERSLALLLPSQCAQAERVNAARVGLLVQAGFIFGRSRETGFSWQTLYSVLLQSVEKRDATLTKAALDTFQRLLEEYLCVFPVFTRKLEAMGAIPPDEFNMNYNYHFSPPHPRELKLGDLAIRASQNGSADCLNETVNSIYALACMCFKKDKTAAFRDIVFELLYAYETNASDSNASSRLLSGEIMHRLPSVAKEIDHCLFEHEDSLDHVEKVRRFSMPYYSLCLHLLKRSSERADQRMFDRVMKDLEEFLKHDIPRDVQSLRMSRDPDGGYLGINYGLRERPPQEQGKFVDLWSDLHDYRCLVYVVSGAWLAYQIQERRLSAEDVAPFLAKLVSALPDFRHLLDLYAIPGMGGLTSARDNPLDFDRWDWPHSPYSNPRWGTEFQRWIAPFYRFLLLKKASQSVPRRIALDAIRHTQAADHRSLCEFLAHIASDDFRLPVEYEGALWSLSAEDIAKAKEGIKSLLVSWLPPDLTADAQTTAEKDSPEAPTEAKQAGQAAEKTRKRGTSTKRQARKKRTKGEQGESEAR